MVKVKLIFLSILSILFLLFFSFSEIVIAAEKQENFDNCPSLELTGTLSHSEEIPLIYPPFNKEGSEKESLKKIAGRVSFHISEEDYFSLQLEKTINLQDEGYWIYLQYPSGWTIDPEEAPETHFGNFWMAVGNLNNGPIGLELNENIIEALKTWRNEYGRPWTMAVLEKDFSVETLERFMLRRNFAFFLQRAFSEKIWKIRKDISQKFILENKIELDETKNSNYWEQLWFQKNMSEVAGIYYLSTFREAFAWYTSPDYIEGSLPEEIEKVIEEGLNEISLARNDPTFRPTQFRFREFACHNYDTFQTVLAGELPPPPEYPKAMPLPIIDFLVMLKFRHDLNQGIDIDSLEENFK